MSPTSHLPFFTHHTVTPTPPSSSTTFCLTAPSSSPTDIWRKPGPPTIKTFNAPLIYKSIPLSTFQRARVTVSARWERLYDQGGLVFILKDSENGEAGKEEDQKWVKTGIEYYEGEAYVSTVVADRWADWSLVQVGIQDGSKVTLEIERSEKEGTLWVFVVGEGGKRIPIREITWILSEDEGDQKEVWVGIYTAMPNADGRPLEVRFEGWELEVTE